MKIDKKRLEAYSEEISKICKLWGYNSSEHCFEDYFEDASYFDSIPYISFYIDDYEYKLHKSNFIMRLPRTCKLDIIDNYFDNTTWELSVNFLKEYSLLFNYTDNSVTFYNVSNFNLLISFVISCK